MELAKELLRIAVDYDVPVDSGVDSYNRIIAEIVAARLDRLQSAGDEYGAEQIGWIRDGD